MKKLDCICAVTIGVCYFLLILMLKEAFYGTALWLPISLFLAIVTSACGLFELISILSDKPSKLSHSAGIVFLVTLVCTVICL